MKLTNKTILITGASSGLGRAMAVSLSRGNNTLVVTARRKERLESLAEEVQANGSRCVVVVADATEVAQTQAVIDAAIEAGGGKVDVAILNAGGGKPMSMADAGIDDVLHIMRTNYETFVNFLCPLIAHMKSAGGILAYTGSPAGYFGLPKSGPYSAAKAAGRVLFDTCRIELAKSPIRFVALYPGFTATEGLDVADVPVKALIIDKERAAREMLGAIKRQTGHHMFPKRIKFLMLLARVLPEPIRRWLLARAV